MDDLTAQPPLSEAARLIDAFIAPSKTFTDIFRSASWWLPFVVVCIIGWASVFTIGQKVGWEPVAAQQMARNKMQSDQLDQLPADQKAQQIRKVATVTKFVSYGFPVLILAISALIVLVLWLSVNFGLGANTTYKQMFAVWIYAGLPKLFITLLNIILLWAGVGLDNYDIKNPVGTNLGYFLTGSPAWLQEFGSWFDIFNLWALLLLVLGISIVAKKSKGQAAAVVLGWWLLLLLIQVGWAAAMG